MEIPEVPQTAGEALEKNSIPVVREIEKQLRAGVLRDKERLRALVGGNYRDLLSTAEEIVALDRSTREAEVRISDLSRQCIPPQQHEGTHTISSITSSSAQLRLLLQCLTCASTALQARSVLSCAELTVISRLLLKSLGEQQSPPKSIEALRSKALTLRRRLLRLIRSQLAHPSSNVDSLVHAICAYCLVTSVSSGDAIEHFRNVRLEKLRQRVEGEHEDQDQINESFRYLVVSVQLVKSLLGRSVNDALSLLQKQPILQDQTLLRSEALDTDRLSNLIPQDILGFTPYIKRVLLRQEEVQHLSSAWIQEACQIFKKGLQNALASTKSAADVLALRKDLFSIVLPVYFSTPGQESLLETVREVTNARMLELCRTQIGILTKIGHDVVSAKSLAATEPSLWNTNLVQNSLVSNSAKYVRQVRSIHIGTKGDLSGSIKKIRKWARQTAQLRNQFQILESTRWQDILEEPDDEDDDMARQIVSQLSKDDPKHFKDAMETSVQGTITEFNKIMHSAVSEVAATKDWESSEATARIVYLQRALREISTILTSSNPSIKLETTQLASKLHTALAESVTKQITAVPSHQTSPTNSNLSLPQDLPSPQAFKLLSDICKIMTNIGGTDIWSETAVGSLKNKLRAELLDQDNLSRYTQSNFDKHYITAALSSRHNPPTPVEDFSETQTKAQAYWQRTKLLFGVLG